LGTDQKTTEWLYSSNEGSGVSLSGRNCMSIRCFAAPKGMPLTRSVKPNGRSPKFSDIRLFDTLRIWRLRPRNFLTSGFSILKNYKCIVRYFNRSNPLNWPISVVRDIIRPMFWISVEDFSISDDFSHTGTMRRQDRFDECNLGSL
jgi:hypothetical protein